MLNLAIGLTLTAGMIFVTLALMRAAKDETE